MKRAERQNHRPMVDARARQLTRGKDADCALYGQSHQYLYSPTSPGRVFHLADSVENDSRQWQRG